MTTEELIEKNVMHGELLAYWQDRANDLSNSIFENDSAISTANGWLLDNIFKRIKELNIIITKHSWGDGIDKPGWFGLKYKQEIKKEEKVNTYAAMRKACGL